jgi:hypothetical protein
MPHQLRVYEHLFWVEWTGIPEIDELEILLEDLVRRRVAIGRPLVYVAVIPADVDVPSGVQRHDLARFGERATPYVEATHLVLEGAGFKHALQRSAVTAMYFLKQGIVKVYVHRLVDEAIDEVAQAFRRSALELKSGLGLARPITIPPPPPPPHRASFDRGLPSAELLRR